MSKGKKGDSPESQLPVPAERREKAAESTSSALPGLGAISVKMTLILGRTELTIEDAADLNEKSLLRLDRSSNDPVDVCVNGKLIARGRLVVVGDNLGVEIIEILAG